MYCMHIQQALRSILRCLGLENWRNIKADVPDGDNEENEANPPLSSSLPLSTSTSHNPHTITFVSAILNLCKQKPFFVKTQNHKIIYYMAIVYSYFLLCLTHFYASHNLL